MIPEADFVKQAKEFFRSRIGDAAEPLTEDTELVSSGLMDSLLVLEFFFFLEQFRGSAIESQEFSVASISTLRKAYRLVVT